MTFIAGRYTAAYATVDIGITGKGYELQCDFEMEDVGESDAYGMTVIDGIFRGGQCHFQFECLAYKAPTIAMFWPWGGALAAAGVLGTLVNPGAGNVPIGVLASDHARALALASVLGTPAVASPATVSTTKALIAKNNNGKLLFNSTLRNVPIRMRSYPVDAGAGVIKLFTTS